MSKIIKKNKYYYIQKSYRNKNEIIVREKYLGKELSKNIDEDKEIFDKKIRDDRFLKKLLTVQRNFNKEFSKYPKIAKKKYFESFAVKFTYNSQAIEGSTITLKETKLLVEDGISPNKLIREIEESMEHHKLFLEMLDYKKELSRQLIVFWHKRLFEKSYPDMAGKLRSHNVSVSASKTKFPDHIEVDYLLNEFFIWYDKKKQEYNPVELAALVHFKFVSIHPFSDGNGRMSRLLMNYVLYQSKYPLMDIPYVDRKSYYNNLEKSQINNDENHFIEFIIKKYLKDYNKYI